MYRIVTDFILDRPFVHIETKYFNMIFVSYRSYNAFNGDP